MAQSTNQTLSLKYQKLVKRTHFRTNCGTKQKQHHIHRDHRSPYRCTAPSRILLSDSRPREQRGTVTSPWTERRDRDPPGAVPGFTCFQGVLMVFIAGVCFQGVLAVYSVSTAFLVGI